MVDPGATLDQSTGRPAADTPDHARHRQMAQHDQRLSRQLIHLVSKLEPRVTTLGGLQKRPERALRELAAMIDDVVGFLNQRDGPVLLGPLLSKTSHAHPGARLLTAAGQRLQVQPAEASLQHLRPEPCAWATTFHQVTQAQLSILRTLFLVLLTQFETRESLATWTHVLHLFTREIQAQLTRLYQQ